MPEAMKYLSFLLLVMLELCPISLNTDKKRGTQLMPCILYTSTFQYSCIYYEGKHSLRKEMLFQII